jgi:Immunity protein 21
MPDVAVAVPQAVESAWHVCGPGLLDAERRDRFILVLGNTIPACSGHGTGIAEVPGGWWFTSAHPGLTTTLWVRSLASFSYVIAGRPRAVEVEQDRWSRVIKAAHRAFGRGVDAGGLSPSLHLGRAVATDSRNWVSSMGGPLVVVPVSLMGAWGGFGDAGERDGSAVVTDYDRACAVAAHAGVIDLRAGTGQALVLRNTPTACYVPQQRLFVQWVGADSEERLIAAAETVLSNTTTEWQPCGTWEVDGPAVLMDSFLGGSGLSIEDARVAGLPQPASVPISPGRWTVRCGQWTVSVDSEEPSTVGLIHLLPNPR